MSAGEFIEQLVEVFEYFGSLVIENNPPLGLLIIVGGVFLIYTLYVRYSRYLKFKIKKRKPMKRLKPTFLNE